MTCLATLNLPDLQLEVARESRRIRAIDPIERKPELIAELVCHFQGYFAIAALILRPAVFFDVDQFAQIDRTQVERDSRHFQTSSQRLKAFCHAPIFDAMERFFYCQGVKA